MNNIMHRCATKLHLTIVVAVLILTTHDAIAAIEQRTKPTALDQLTPLTYNDDSHIARFHHQSLQDEITPATPHNRLLAPTTTQQTHSKFTFSQCNSNLHLAPCQPFSTWLSTTQRPNFKTVIIPCGTCITVDISDGSTITLPHGLDVVGKLHFSHKSSLTLVTPYIFIQGVLAVDAPLEGTMVPHSHVVRIRLIPSEGKEVEFYPSSDGDNEYACGTNDHGEPQPCLVGQMPILVAGGRLDITAMDPKCPSWVKLYKVDTSRRSIKVDPPSAARCWNRGAELLLTSDTLDPTDVEVVLVEGTDPANGWIFLKDPLSKVKTSMEKSMEMAVEVALLSRNFILETAELSHGNKNMGGHLMVMHTPSIPQTISGVLLYRFGQMGLKGRYPLHLHLNLNTPGTLITQNVIWESHQRCIVIHGTHNVTVSHNVAYDTFGHCYMLEDGGEEDNLFAGNLGSLTKSMERENLVGEDETDDDPATFWFSNPSNNVIGNIAAGSFGPGFWWELRPSIREPTLSLLPPTLQSINPQYLPGGHIRDNTAHSNHNHGFTVYKHGWFPVENTPWINIKAYKNHRSGVFFHATRRMTLTGSYFSDNSACVRTHFGNGIILEDVTCIGQSQHMQNMISENRIASDDVSCHNRLPFFAGVTFQPNEGENEGVTLKNVNFEGFGMCEDVGAALSLESNFVHDLLFDNYQTFEDVTFKEDKGRIRACEALERGVRNVAIEDPGGMISGSGKGFFIQDDPTLTSFLPSDVSCTDVDPNTCLRYCPKACLRLISFESNPSIIRQNVSMMLTDVNKNVTQLIPRSVFYWTGNFENDEKSSFFDETKAGTKAWHGVALPPGEYDVAFIDEAQDNVPVWPDFVRTIYNQQPTCASPTDTYSFTFSYPPSDALGQCTSLLKNGDFESGRPDGWIQLQTNISMISPGAYGSKYAMATNMRSGEDLSYSGRWYLGQSLDMSCLRPHAGRFFEISGLFLLWDAEGRDVECNVGEEGSCPLLKLKRRLWDGRILEEVDVIGVLESRGDGSWWEFSFEYEVPRDIKEVNQAFLFIDGAPGHEFVLDNWAMSLLPTFVESLENSIWTQISGKGRLSPTAITATAKNRMNLPSLLKDSPHGIIWRKCISCEASHVDIFYRRWTSVPDRMNLVKYLERHWSVEDNCMGSDFSLYSTYEDAVKDVNRWKYCNYDNNGTGIGFPRECGPDEPTLDQWSRFGYNDSVGQEDVAFVVEGYAKTVAMDEETLSPTLSPTVALTDALSQRVSTNDMASNPPSEEMTTSHPTDGDTNAPTDEATFAPTNKFTIGMATIPPTDEATFAPTDEATFTPTNKFTIGMATIPPTPTPSLRPSKIRTERPTPTPTAPPTTTSTAPPTAPPTTTSTAPPTAPPTTAPTAPPTEGTTTALSNEIIDLAEKYGTASQKCDAKKIYRAKRAINGNSDGKLSKNNPLAITCATNDPWWKVDLLGDSSTTTISNTIQKILITCRSDRPIVKGLLVSLQDNDNNDLRHFKVRGYCQKKQEVIDLSREEGGGVFNVRYVTLMLKHYEASLQLAQVKVMGYRQDILTPTISPTITPPQLINLAREDSSIASQKCNMRSIYRANRAIDGNTNGKLSRKNPLALTCTTSNPWWKLDLSSPSLIQKIRVTCRSDKPVVKKLVVLLQDDDEKTRHEFKIRGYCQKKVEVMVLPGEYGVEARYVVLQMDRASASLQLAEVEVWGYKMKQEEEEKGRRGLSLRHRDDVSSVTTIMTSSTITLPHRRDLTSSNLINLALDGFATQSCTNGSNDANFAIDNNTNGDFNAKPSSVSSTCNKGSTSWWMVDLGAVYAIAPAVIAKIKIYNRVDCCGQRLREFKVQILTDGDDDKDVVWETYHKEPAGDTVPIIPPENTMGRYVRIIIDKTVWLQLAEVRVLGYPTQPPPSHPPLINLAKIYGVADQSCTLSPYYADLAIDGDVNGDLKGGGSVSSTCCNDVPRWTVDLGDEDGGMSYIHHIVVYNRMDCCSVRLKSFVVEVLDDSNNVVWSFEQDNEIIPMKKFIVNDGTIGRYVQLRMLRQGCLQLAEVQVFGFKQKTLGEESESSKPPSPADVNLALNGHAEQSCTLESYAASLAIDNDTNGDFNAGSVSSTCCGGGLEQWWKVTFPYGSQNIINAITIYNRMDCCSDRLFGFVVEILDADGVVVWEETQDFRMGPQRTFRVGGDVVGSAVRIRLLREACLQLTEVEVMGYASITAMPTPTMANVALRRTSWQACTFEGNGPDLANDGNTDGDYDNGSVMHTCKTEKPWWRVDLGSRHHVVRVVIYNRTDKASLRLRDFDVEVLDENTDVVASKYSDEFVDEMVTFYFEHVVGRFVHVRLRNEDYFHIAEVEVYGYEAEESHDECHFDV